MAQDSTKIETIKINDWIVRPERNIIEYGGSSVSLEPRHMDFLVYLCVNQGRVVPRNELLEAIWPDTIVTEHALSRAVSELRKVFRDDPDKPSIIETIRKRGYRLIPEVEILPSTAPTEESESISGSLHIASPVSGRFTYYKPHWPTAIMTSVLISILWVLGIVIFSQPELRTVKTYTWSDGSPIPDSVMRIMETNQYQLPSTVPVDSILAKFAQQKPK